MKEKPHPIDKDFAYDKEEQSKMHSADSWFEWVKKWEQQLKSTLEIKKDE